MRILVIVDYCGFEDALRMSVFVPPLRLAYPDAKLVLLAPRETLPIFERLAVCDGLVASSIYPKRSARTPLMRVRKLAAAARTLVAVGLGYDLVVVLGWATTTLDVIGPVAGRQVLGYANRWPKLLSSGLPPFEHTSKTLEEQCNALLELAGANAVSDAPPRLATEHDHEAAEVLLKEAGLYTRPLAVLHPGSDWACQQWRSESWALLADRLIEDLNFAIAFTGSNSEEPFIQSIKTLMSHESVSLAGRTSLAQFEAILGSARLCVCVDSVARELASMAAVPTVVLSGRTSTHRLRNHLSPVIVVDYTAPQRRETIDRCKERHDQFGGCLDYSCPLSGLNDIGVDDVLAAVRQILAPHTVLTDAAQ